MKCTNCGVEVDKKFAHSVKKNECPACGKSIMSPEKLAAYGSLKELLSSLPNINASQVAGLVIANFDIKQLFKTAAHKNAVSADDDVVEVTEGDDDEAAANRTFDELHKAEQLAEAKKKLKEMKENAYEDALRDQYGMGSSEDGDVDGDGSDIFANLDGGQIKIVNQMKTDQKRETGMENMLSGQGGFTRSES